VDVTHFIHSSIFEGTIDTHSKGKKYFSFKLDTVITDKALNRSISFIFCQLFRVIIYIQENAS